MLPAVQERQRLQRNTDKKKTVFVVTVKSTPCVASSIRKENETMYRIDRTEWGADGSSSTSSYYYYSWSKVW